MGAGDEAPCPGSDPPVGKTGADPGRGEIRDGAAAEEAEEGNPPAKPGKHKILWWRKKFPNYILTSAPAGAIVGRHARGFFLCENKKIGVRGLFHAEEGERNVSGCEAGRQGGGV